MSKNWTDKLPDLLEGYTEAEPEGLWDAVQAGLPAEKRRVAAIWWFAGAAALLAAAAIAAIVILRPSTPETPVVAPVVIADSGEDELIVSAPEELAPQSVPSGPRIVPAQEIPAETEPIVDEPEPIVDEPEPIIDNSEPNAESTVPVVDTTETPEPPVPPSIIDTTPQNTRPAEKPVRHLPKLNPRVQVLFALSTAPGNGVSTSFSGVGIPSAPGIVTKANGATGSLSMLSRNKASITDATHRQASRMSVGLKVDLDEHWGIESGIVSSTVESRYNSMAGFVESTTVRSMKYLGIPLYGCYNVFELGRLGLTLSAGPMYEFSTATSSRTSSSVSGHSTGKTSDNTPIDDDKWSVNAGAAFQYRVRNHGALFVQPGVSYHFKDNAAVETIYTEQPASFNLTFGYKFEF